MLLESECRPAMRTARHRTTSEAVWITSPAAAVASRERSPSISECDIHKALPTTWSMSTATGIGLDALLHSRHRRIAFAKSVHEAAAASMATGMLQRCRICNLPPLPGAGGESGRPDPDVPTAHTSPADGGRPMHVTDLQT